MGRSGKSQSREMRTVCRVPKKPAGSPPEPPAGAELEAESHAEPEDPRAQVLGDAAERRRVDVPIPYKDRVGIEHIEQVRDELRRGVAHAERPGEAQVQVPEVVVAER